MFKTFLWLFTAVQLYEESLQDASGNPPGPATDVFWQFSAPAGLRSVLAWVTKRYQRPELWVTESGMAVAGEANMTREDALNDEPRLAFFRYATGRVCSSTGGAGVVVSTYRAASHHSVHCRAGLHGRSQGNPCCGSRNPRLLTIAAREHQHIGASLSSHQCHTGLSHCFVTLHGHTAALQAAPGQCMQGSDGGQCQLGSVICLEFPGQL